MTEEQANYGDKIEAKPDGGFVVHLDDPVTFKPSKMDEEKTVDRLEIVKKIKGKHLKAMDQAEGEMGKTLALIAKVTGIPRHAADELSSVDIDRIMGVIEPFLPVARKTGS